MPMIRSTKMTRSATPFCLMCFSTFLSFHDRAACTFWWCVLYFAPSVLRPTSFTHRPSSQATPLKWETLDYRCKRDESMKEGGGNGVSECKGEMRSEHKEKKRCHPVQPSKKMDSNGESIECKGKQSPSKTKVRGREDVINKKSLFHPFFAFLHFLWPYSSIHSILLWFRWSSSSNLTLFCLLFRRHPTRAIVICCCCCIFEREIKSWLIALGILLHLWWAKANRTTNTNAKGHTKEEN